MYIVDKPKIFVRYYPGASGYFFSLFLHTLAQDVAEMSKDQYAAHINHPIINEGHNFEEQVEYDPTMNDESENDSCISNVFKVGYSASQLREKCKFTETQNAIYTVPTHTLQPITLMTAFPPSTYNTKLINIQHSYGDMSQISYNIVTKSVIPWGRIDYVKTIAKNLLKKYPEKAKNPKFNIDETVLEDTRFLCYLYKDSIESPESFYSEFLENTKASTSLSIPFESMGDLSLISYIDTILDYTGIESTDERRNNAINLLSKYSSAQRENPYKDLHIDDY